MIRYIFSKKMNNGLFIDKILVAGDFVSRVKILDTLENMKPENDITFVFDTYFLFVCFCYLFFFFF